MDLTFMVLAQRPLGLMLAEIVAVLERHSVLKPQRFSLGARSHDSFDYEMADVASKVSAATMTVVLASGSVEIRWAHGDQSHEQILIGSVSVNKEGLKHVQVAMRDLCVLTDSFYALLDLKSIAASDSDHWEMGLPVSPYAFYSLYWYNVFGCLYRAELPADLSTIEHYAHVATLENGATLIALKTVPMSAGREEAVRAITKQWTVFRKYSEHASFTQEVCPDYSLVRNVPLPYGEYWLGAKVLTERRHAFLVSNGLGPLVREGEEVFHVIQPHFCEMLGIDPQDMLVICLREGIAAHYRQQIESQFAQLPEDIPLAERVWIAHDKGCRGVSPKIKSFMKRQFLKTAARD